MVSFFLRWVIQSRKSDKATWSAAAALGGRLFPLFNSTKITGFLCFVFLVFYIWFLDIVFFHTLKITLQSLEWSFYLARTASTQQQRVDGSVSMTLGFIIERYLSPHTNNKASLPTALCPFHRPRFLKTANDQLSVSSHGPIAESWGVFISILSWSCGKSFKKWGPLSPETLGCTLQLLHNQVNPFQSNIQLSFYLKCCTWDAVL